MNLSQLRPPKGAKRERKRVGRGNASGTGTYSGKGLKGQKARSGPMPYAGFEGGQWPLVRKIARKPGFAPPVRIRYEEVKLSDLGRLAGMAEVGPEQFTTAGLIKYPKMPIKILSNGGIQRPVTVRAHAFTKAAREQIEAAGGRAEELPFAGRKVKAPVIEGNGSSAQADGAGTTPAE